MWAIRVGCTRLRWPFRWRLVISVIFEWFWSIFSVFWLYWAVFVVCFKVFGHSSQFSSHFRYILPLFSSFLAKTFVEITSLLQGPPDPGESRARGAFWRGEANGMSSSLARHRKRFVTTIQGIVFFCRYAEKFRRKILILCHFAGNFWNLGRSIGYFSILEEISFKKR